jgi:hypothetical protein
LRRQAARVRYAPGDRLWLAALSRWFPPPVGEVLAVTLAALLAWHRRLVAQVGLAPATAVPGGRPRQLPRFLRPFLSGCREGAQVALGTIAAQQWPAGPPGT